MLLPSVLADARRIGSQPGQHRDLPTYQQNLPSADEVNRLLDESGGATLVVGERSVCFYPFDVYLLRIASQWIDQHDSDRGPTIG